MNNLGLVFSGGGGKGAYEIGVWKALRQYGLDQKVTALAGTSVGGLNAALFQQGDYDKAEKVWATLITGDILKLSAADIPSSFGKKVFTSFFPRLTEVAQKVPFLNKLKSHGVFSEAGLRRLIADNLDCGLVSRHSRPFKVCAYHDEEERADYITMNGLSETDIVDALMASAAIPFLFSQQEVAGQHYSDGGIGKGRRDNSPIPAVAGCDIILCIMLDPLADTLSHEMKLPNTHVWKIVPSQDLGGIFDGALNFDGAKAKRLIELGYQDTLQVLLRLMEWMETEARFRASAGKFAEQNLQFAQIAAIGAELREGTRKSRLILTDLSEGRLPLLLEGTALPRLETEAATAVPSLDQLDTLLKQQERDLISRNINEFLDGIKGNSDEMEELAFASITALSPIPSRVKAVHEQGVFSRLWNGITGKNLAAVNQNVHDLHRAVYTAQEMIRNLSERHALTFDAMTALGNQVTYLGTVTQHHELQFQQVYQYLGGLQHRLRHSFDSINARMEEMQKQINRVAADEALDRWLITLPSQSFNGKLWRKLPLSQRLALGVSGYFSRVESITPCQATFRLMLHNLDITADDLLSPSDFIRELSEHRPLLQACLSSAGALDKLLPLSEEKRPLLPLLRSVEMVHQRCTQNPEQIVASAREETGLSSVAIPADALAAEFYCSLRMAAGPRSGDARAVLKGALSRLALLLEKEDGAVQLRQKVLACQDKLEHFRLKAPIVGPFSAGKSTLLNTAFFPSEVILKVDTCIETALAAELYHSDRSQIIARDLKGNSSIYPISELQALKQRSGQLLNLEIHRPIPALASLPDLIPVDMPGLDSPLESHNKAILSYIDEGSFYIILIPVDNGDIPNSVKTFLKRELKLYGLNCAILISKCGHRTAAQVAEVQTKVAETARELLGKEIYVGQVECGGSVPQLADFQRILELIPARKNELIKRRFLPQVKSLAEEALFHFKGCLSKIDLSPEALKAQIAELEREAPKLQRELQDLLADLQRDLVEDGVDELGRSTDAALTADSLHSPAKSSALPQAVNSIIRPLIVTGIKRITEEKLERYKDKLQKILGKASSVNVDVLAGINVPEAKSAVGTALAGAAAGAMAGMVFGPIGVIIGGALGALGGWLFGNNNAQREAEERFQNQLQTQVVPQARQAARQAIEKAFRLVHESLSKTIQEDFSQRIEDSKARLQDVKRQQEENAAAIAARRQSWEAGAQGSAEILRECHD